MATSLVTRETTGADATVKNAPLTNEEVDLNFISITNNKLEADNNLSDLNSATTARSNLGLEIGVDVQAFDANTAKLDATTSNFTGDLQVSGSSVVVDSDIGSTVQAFDANNATFDAVNPTFTNTGALGVPSGTQAQRPGTPENGQIRFNADTNKFEGYDGTQWDVISGDAEVSVTGGSGLSGSGSFNLNDTTTTSITLDHADTSSQSSVTNSAATVIQNVSLDAFGHVTSLDSKTLSKSDFSLDTTDDVQFDSLGVGTAASGTSGEIRATNDVTAFFSDDRLKTRLGGIEGALEKVCSLDGFYYEPNDTAVELGYERKRYVGVSAQSVQNVLPEVVKTAPISDKYLTVQYEKLVPMLIEAIKELEARVAELELGR